jgi:hypothetical protein
MNIGLRRPTTGFQRKADCAPFTGVLAALAMNAGQCQAVRLHFGVPRKGFANAIGWLYRLWLAYRGAITTQRAALLGKAKFRVATATAAQNAFRARINTGVAAGAQVEKGSSAPGRPTHIITP